MAQSEIAFRESFDYWNGHVIAAGTYYMALIRGSVFPIGAGTITSSSTLAGLTECSGTGYARKSFVLGASTNGVMAIPQILFDNGGSAWSSNCAAAAMCAASSGGVAVYCWDLTAVRDMSVAATLTIATLNIFLENPGGI